MLTQKVIAYIFMWRNVSRCAAEEKKNYFGLFLQMPLLLEEWGEAGGVGVEFRSRWKKVKQINKTFFFVFCLFKRKI